MMEGLKNEFRLKNVFLRHHKREDFCRLNEVCRLPPRFLWCVRCGFAVYSVISVALSVLHEKHIHESGMWIAHLTNWTLLCDTLYFIIATVVSGCHHFPVKRQPDTKDIVMSEVGEYNEKQENDDENTDLPLHVRIMWLLFNIVYDCNVIVVSLYWTVLNRGRPVTYYRINPHGVVFVLLLFDYTFHMIPVRILHVVYTCAYGMVFLVFSVIHDLVTGVPVYPVLDFKHKTGRAAALSAMSCVVLIFAHFVLYFFNWLKERIKKRDAAS